MTEREWPTTDTGRVAATAHRLGELLEEFGPMFEQRAGEYQKTRLPSFTATGERTREEVALSKMEAQLAKDAADWRPALLLVNDVMADYIDRIVRVTAVNQTGERCSACGNTIDPKKEKAKFWRGKQPHHPVCYQRRLRAEGKAS